MKRPTMLTRAILAQASMDLSVSIDRDYDSIRNRIEHEGFSFLTITLPKLSDALEAGLNCGLFTCPSNFARHGRLPRLLGGFFNRVFEKDCGSLRPNPCHLSILWIRQICRFWKKLKIECSPDRNRAAIRNYVAIERELAAATVHIQTKKDAHLDKVSRILWDQVFPDPDSNDFVCRHGPGVTADRLLSNERHRIRQWHTRSELTFPSDLHAYPTYEYACEASRGGDSVEYVDIRHEQPVRVVFVPKTLTTPRVIAIEPSHVQFMQQAVMDYMVTRLELHPLTKGSVRFTCQKHNQEAARRASLDGRYATIDMKDASDRVHFVLVQRIFSHCGILEYLEDSRSVHADLPDGTNVILSKFASMGSATCFPVEACVFYTLILSCMHAVHKVEPSLASISRYSRDISIYGDDIVIPVEWTESVIDYLEKYSLRVNRDKSHWSGNFRESCGADYFCGTDVKPVYARQLIPDRFNASAATQIMAWVATHNQFYEHGYWIVASAIREMLWDLNPRIPLSRHETSGVALLSVFNEGVRFNVQLQRLEQRRPCFSNLSKRDSIDGDGRACWSKYHHIYGDDSGRHRSTRMQSSVSSGRSLRINDSEELAVTTWNDIRLRGPIDRKLQIDESTKRGGFALKHRWILLPYDDRMRT